MSFNRFRASFHNVVESILSGIIGSIITAILGSIWRHLRPRLSRTIAVKALLSLLLGATGFSLFAVWMIGGIYAVDRSLATGNSLIFFVLIITASVFWATGRRFPGLHGSAQIALLGAVLMPLNLIVPWFRTQSYATATISLKYVFDVIVGGGALGEACLILAFWTIITKLIISRIESLGAVPAIQDDLVPY